MPHLYYASNADTARSNPEQRAGRAPPARRQNPDLEEVKAPSTASADHSHRRLPLGFCASGRPLAIAPKSNSARCKNGRVLPLTGEDNVHA
jgi:hypothetical protein